MAAAVVMALLLGQAAVAHAGAPQEQERIADDLHRRAVEDYKAGRLEKAIRTWEAAEALNKHWKYAYNMALALQENDQMVRAWKTLRRAVAYGVPEKHVAMIAALTEHVEEELFATHALLDLDVNPPEANVVRNGGLWIRPRVLWSKDGLSELVASHPDYELLERTWQHPIGSRHTLTLTLVSTAPSPLHGEAAPPASAFARKRPAKGTPPAVSQAALPPAVDMGASKEAGEAQGSSLGTWAWVSLGTGGAALVGSVVLFLRQQDLVQQMEDLNAAPKSADFADYDAQYDGLESDRSQAGSTGLVFAGLGVALVGTGVALVLMGGDDHEAATSTSWMPLWSPDLVGLQGVLRF